MNNVKLILTVSYLNPASNSNLSTHFNVHFLLKKLNYDKSFLLTRLINVAYSLCTRMGEQRYETRYDICATLNLI